MKTGAKELARRLRISPQRGTDAIMKAQLIAAVAHAAQEHGLTHVELAKRSGLPRSAVTGILSGSLQKITVDRVLRLVEAAGLIAEVRIRKAA